MKFEKDFIIRKEILFRSKKNKKLTVMVTHYPAHDEYVFFRTSVYKTTSGIPFDRKIVKKDESFDLEKNVLERFAKEDALRAKALEDKNAKS